MKTVAVSQRVDSVPDRGEIRDGLDQRLNHYLLEAGYLPVPVPNGLYKTRSNGVQDSGPLKAWISNLAPTAFVLSGGNDIGKCFARDLTESEILKYAQVNQLPVLGICRGMQMMAHMAGTALKRVQGHVRTRHQIYGKISGEVNSYHALALESCPDGYVVLASSEDGEIEAIQHISLPWEGWMWHPERETVATSHDIQRLKAIFK
jgi:putative glutamine amidotransferase